MPVIKRTFVQKNIANPTKFFNLFYSSVLALLLLMVGVGSVNATTYYSWTNVAPNSTASWWTGTNGTGGQPTNFGNAADVFIVQKNNTMALNGDWTVAGSVQISNGCTLTIGAYNLTISGTTTVGGGTSGTLTIGSYNGNKIFAGLLTVSAGGTWDNSVGSPITFQGGITNNGTFKAGTNGPQTFNTNPQNLNGTIDMSGAAVTVTGITLTNYGTLTVTSNFGGTGTFVNSSTGTINTTAQITNSTFTNQGIANVSGGNLTPTTTLTNASTGILNISGNAYTNSTTFTNQGTLTYTSTNGINVPIMNIGAINVQSPGYYIASITNNAGSTLNISSLSCQINSLTATATGNTVNYSGLGAQTIINTTYSNLILSGSGTKTFAASTTINGDFTINTNTKANLVNGFNHTLAGNLILGGVQQTQDGSWGSTTSATNINTIFFSNSTGIINVTTPPTIICPPSVTAFANPLTGLIAAYPFNETSGTIAYDVIGNQNANLVNSPTWNTTGKSVGSVTLDGGTTSASDYIQLPTGIVSSLTGNFTISTWVYWTGGNSWQRIFDFGSSTSNYMFLTPSNATYPYTPRFAIITTSNGSEQALQATSSISTNAWHHFVVTLSGNTGTLYIDGAVAATNTSMTLHPSNLGNTANNWIGKSQWSDPYFKGKIDEFRIYNIALTAAQVTSLYGASSCTASADYGSGLGAPTVMNGVTPVMVTNNASYPLPLGVNTITWTAKDASNQTSTCTQSVTAITSPPTFGGTLSNQSVINTTYTLNGGLPTGGTYSGTGVTGTNFNASVAGVGTYTITYSYTYTYADGTSCTKTATNTINVVLASITTGTITGSPFNTGDAVAVPFTTNGAFTAGNVFTAQLSDASGSFTSPVTIGTLTATGSGTINGIIPVSTPAGTGYRIRVISNTPAVTGTDNGVNITINAGASITRSVTALSGFSYMVGNGPSAEQSFTVGGTSLTAPIIVTPPADFEVSVLSGGMFYSSTSSPTNSISLTPVGNAVSATIYVRLKAGLSVATYGSENITFSSTGFTSKTVSCIGSVLPLITAGTSGSYCPNENINLTSTIDASALSYYWEGPNNFYSQVANPTISSPLTTANAGTYTITATYVDPTATNLVINGDFQTGTPAGNDLTQYQYMPTSAHALENMNGTHSSTAGEGNYAVCNLPHDVHSGYSTNPPESGNYQMVVNGSTVASDIVWGQTINNITSNTSYQFSYWEQSAVAGTPSKLRFYANGSPAVSVYTAPSTTNNWQLYTYTWNSGSSTSVTLTLQDAENSAGGNDFAIDNIVFQRVSANSASVNVTVNTTSAPASVSIAASPGSNVNAGTNVTFTATALNAGHPPTYQWYNGSTAISGATSSTYSFIPTGGEKITCQIKSTSSCPVNNNVIPSNTIMMTVYSTINYWLGATSTDWGNPANWTAGNIPGTGDNIVFSTTSTSYGDAKRDLFLDADRTIGSLTNKSTKALVIPPAKCLTVNGKITTNGVSSPGSIYIQAYPDGTQQNGSLIFPNETNKVYGTVEMYSKAHSIAAPGIQYPAGTGPYYRFSWQYFGIPINTINADPTFYGSYVRKWDETGKTISTHWVQLGNSDQLSPFIGYEITQDVPVGKLIVFQGQLINTPYVSASLARSPGGVGGALFPGQYVFANPYTAAIDIKKFISRLGLDTDGYVYLYSTGSYADWGTNGQGSTNGTSAGQYQVVTGASGIGIPTQIPSMQAILVQMKLGAQTGSTVTFNYSDVVKNNDLQRVKGVTDDNSSASSMVYTMIDVAGSQFNDRMWIFTDSTFTKTFDRGWDGTKMLGIAIAPQLYANEPDGQYQINCVNDMNNTVLGFERGVDDTYTFTFTHENTDTRYSGIYLVDSIEHKTIDITASGSQYQFTVDSNGVYSNRFKIITRSYEPNDPEANSKIKVFNSNGMVFVQNLSSEQGQFSLYDMAGRQLNRTLFGPNSVTQVCTVAQQGIYVGKAATNSEKNTKRFIVQ